MRLVIYRTSAKTSTVPPTKFLPCGRHMPENWSMAHDDGEFFWSTDFETMTALKLLADREGRPVILHVHANVQLDLLGMPSKLRDCPALEIYDAYRE